PFGMKGGPMPVLLAAWLQYHSDDVAVYEDGVFQPRLTSDLLERVVRNPDRFGLKAVIASRRRRELLTKLGEVFTDPALKHGRLRNKSILSVVGPLLSRVRA